MMNKQERPIVTEFGAVILGLMLVLYLALVFLGGVDYASAFELVLYALAGLAVMMIFGLSLATLRNNDIRKIFILYDAQDAGFVSKLYDALKMAPFRILWDKKEVQVGDNTDDKLKELFDSSSDIIFVVSHQSVGASWTNPAIAKSIKKNKRIFPVLLDDAAPPEPLQGIKAADFRLSFDDGYFSLREALRTRRKEAPSPAKSPNAGQDVQQETGQNARPSVEPTQRQDR
ncbi:toll/interleukin-1 receptor domain-containing protein [Thiorhodovibrio winogradskyi]|nr:toll/interleukin-1 receptor domain-containing protein [Thiorhodovibrio winogradskyi]